MLKFEKFLFFWLFLAIPLIYYHMEKTFWRDVDHIFFIGIGGISMSGLAAYLIGKGFSVSGSDIAENGRIARLRASGARIFIGHRSENIGEAQIVVCSSAIKQNNPERLAALAKGLPVIGRADLLSAIASDYKNVVAVAGCHGKTTATAMCAHAIENCAGGVTFTGKCAEKLFENCSRAALMTVTAGHALDAEINRLSVSDMKNAFALDAAGVAAVECVADEAEETVRLNTAIGEKLTMRFSPGYGDMPLSLSRAIASATDAQRRTGVTVTEGDMLVPSKSVTAVIGIVDAGKSNTYARK